MSEARVAAPRLPWPWLDRGGRFSWLRAVILLASLAPATTLLWLLAAGELGADPWKQATQEAGTLAIRLLLVSLAVTPLRWLADWPRLVTLRRMLGLLVLGHAVLHLMLYAGSQGWDWLAVGSEIAKRVYLTLGFAVLLGLGVLGWTSTDGWQRRLGRRWKRLHRLAYALAALGILHAFLQARQVDAEVVLAGCFLWLMLWRALPATQRTGVPALLGLAVVTALGTAAMEFAWYAAATKLPAARILAANLGLDAGLRPAQGIGLAALALVPLPPAMRAWRRFARAGKRRPGR